MSVVKKIQKWTRGKTTGLTKLTLSGRKRRKEAAGIARTLRAWR